MAPKLTPRFQIIEKSIRGDNSIRPHGAAAVRQSIARNSGVPSTHALVSWSTTTIAITRGMPQRQAVVIFSRESQSIVKAIQLPQTPRYSRTAAASLGVMSG